MDLHHSQPCGYAVWLSRSRTRTCNPGATTPTLPFELYGQIGARSRNRTEAAGLQDRSTATMLNLARTGGPGRTCTFTPAMGRLILSQPGLLFHTRDQKIVVDHAVSAAARAASWRNELASPPPSHDRQNGAGSGNRTRVSALATPCSTTEPYLQKRRRCGLPDQGGSRTACVKSDPDIFVGIMSGYSAESNLDNYMDKVSRCYYGKSKLEGRARIKRASDGLQPSV